MKVMRRGKERNPVLTREEKWTKVDNKMVLIKKYIT
jgi:hypothetical protein